MEQEYKDIEQLVERFFEGETSNEEEQRIYTFFSGNDIPEGLQRYTSTFRYFADEIKDEFTGEEESYPLPETPKRKNWLIWAGMAAVALILIGIYPFLMGQKNEFNPFEGSYLVRDGERVTDLEEIKPVLELKLQVAQLREEKAERLMALEEYGTEELSRIEQDINNRYCEILNRFSDENTRAEVREILDIDCN